MVFFFFLTFLESLCIASFSGRRNKKNRTEQLLIHQWMNLFSLCGDRFIHFGKLNLHFHNIILPQNIHTAPIHHWMYMMFIFTLTMPIVLTANVVCLSRPLHILKGRILQYFWPSWDYLLPLRSLFRLFEWPLKTGLYCIRIYKFVYFGVNVYSIKQIKKKKKKKTSGKLLL